MIVYRKLGVVSRRTIHIFLSGLTSELEHWRERSINKKTGKFHVRSHIQGYGVFDGNKMIALGYFYLLKEFDVPTANVSIVVKKEYQNQKIGARLYILLEVMAKKRRIKRFHATHDIDNEIISRSILRRGWKTVESTKSLCVIEKELK